MKIKHTHTTHQCTYIVEVSGKSISIDHEVDVKRTLQQTFINV